MSDRRHLTSAPGAPARLTTGRLCLELVATVRGRFSDGPQDDIADVPGLGGWLTGLGTAPVRSPHAADVSAFQELREAVFRLASVIADPAATENTPRATDIALLNRLTKGDVPVARIRARATPDGTVLVADLRRPTCDEVRTALARDAVDLFTGTEIEQLRQCQAEPCGAFYLDTSRGAQRRWCSSASCGNRARVAAHRERRRG